MTPNDFIHAIAPDAMRSMSNTKIPASFVIAEAALESRWGSHCPGFNLFGVKADNSWHGDFTIQRTREYINGKAEIIDSKFRAYKSWLDSIEDHAQFLLKNKRYSHAFSCKDTESFVNDIAKAGYATDPNYAKKIIKIINTYKLDQFDKNKE